MDKDILLWSNIEIFNALDKWGVLTLRNLHNQLCFDISMNGLRRKVHKLAKEEFVQISRTNVKNEIIILPTRKTLNHLKSNRSVINENMIYHNHFLSIIGTEFLNRENVIYCRLPHEYQSNNTPLMLSVNNSISDGIHPDAYLGINHNDGVKKVAIEVELTQKSSDRIHEKFKQYKESKYFDYVVYFFKSNNVLAAYKRRLEELKVEFKSENEYEKLTSKILFLHSIQNYQNGSMLDKAYFECDSKELSIDKFFGLPLNLNDKLKNKNIQ